MASSQFLKPHDLLELQSAHSVQNLDSAPTWVYQSLLACPYVVVRRSPALANGIAIGVRGQNRAQRWAGTVEADQTKRKISPYELRINNELNLERISEIPALRHLMALQKAWSKLELDWGPGGSVGFELASGTRIANPTSDLDIVVSAPLPFKCDYANLLLKSVQKISKQIDVLVETPHCAFSLIEHAACSGRPLLLRYSDKPRLAIDPWQDLQPEQVASLSDLSETTV